jgi:hypothetical protein
MKPACFISVLCLFLSCSGNKVPKDVLGPEKMQEVMWDMISAGEFLSGYVLNKDSVDRFAESSKMYGKVLQVHRITREQFDKSYLYYRQHPEMMKVILDTLSQRQSRPEELYKPRIDSVTVADSARLPDSLKKPIPFKKRPGKSAAQ